MWHRLLRSDDLPRGAVVAAELPATDAVGDNAPADEIVVWRASDGTPCAAARRCPHLDWDLIDSTVQGSELVCAGHGWSIMGDGRAFKRNEFGREDPKGTTRAVAVRDHDGYVEAATG